MTKQTATPSNWMNTPALWLKILMWIPVPVMIYMGGVHWVAVDNLQAGLNLLGGLTYLIVLTKAVNPSLWVTVGVRFSVAAFFFYAGAEREMGHLSNAIGWGIAGLLVYAWLFRPDWSVVGIGVAENASEAKDDSATDESEKPD
jgi:hypothetical protein